MCRKIWCDGESWKFFAFWGELNKALLVRRVSEFILGKENTGSPDTNMGWWTTVETY